MPTDLEPVYHRLKSILEPYGRLLHVTDEGPTSYGIDMAPEGERNPTTWFGGVRSGKRYVSYYLMPVYVEPALIEGISPELKRHMQGKSCFNFTKVDEGLFAELDGLTRAGFERIAGDPTWGAAKRVRPGVAAGLDASLACAGHEDAPCQVLTRRQMRSLPP